MIQQLVQLQMLQQEQQQQIDQEVNAGVYWWGVMGVLVGVICVLVGVICVLVGNMGTIYSILAHVGLAAAC